MSQSTADLCDRHAALVEAGHLRILRGTWRWFGATHRFSGRVVTLQAHGCNHELRELLRQPGHGQVLVVDAGGEDGALLGDNLAALALASGWHGVLVNGNVRDAAALATMSLPVLACGTWSQRSRNEPGGIVAATLAFGGTTLRCGEWMWADQDGVLISKEVITTA